MRVRTGVLVAAAAAVLLVLGGAGWDRHEGVLLDDAAEQACAAVRTADRARGEAVQQRAHATAVSAAQRSEVDDLRRAAEDGHIGVAEWCEREG